MKIYLSFLILAILTVGSVNTRAVEVGSDVKIGASGISAIDPQAVYCSAQSTFLLVWTNDSSGYNQIYYNLVSDIDLNSTGSRLSSVKTGTFLYAEKPQLAYGASTGIAGVVYTESFAYHRDRIMLSYIDVSSGTVTGSYSVGEANSWNMSATVASDNNGTFLVAYYDTTTSNISAKVFNTNGVQQGTTKTLGSIPTGYLLPYSIDIAYNSVNNNFLVVWADFEQKLNSITIDKNGVTGTLVNYASIWAVANPAVAFNPVNNEFFVVYDNFAGVVKGQLLDNAGQIKASTFTFGNAKLESNADVFYNNLKGVFAITWQQYLDSAGIWIQEYKSHDCPFLYDSVQISNLSLTANAPVIAFDGKSKNYWTIWYGDSGGKDEIYMQRYESDVYLVKAICKNITVYLDSEGKAVIAESDIDGGSTAICGAPSLSVSKDTIRCADTPSVNIDLIATDNLGRKDTCTATITVLDTISPAAVCQNITVYLDGTGSATITAADIDNGSSDNCTLGTLTASQTDFDCTDVGDVTVTLTVPDVNGNSKTCTSTVTVQDTISPAAVCQNITVYLDGTGAATITAADIDNGSSDNCTLGTLTASLTDFDCTDVGDVTVTLTVSDVNGNSKTCTSTVTVQDTISPAAVCQNITVYLDGTGAATITAADIDNGSSDNCTLGTLTASQTDFDCTDVGDVTVTLTVPDVNGNSKTCTSTVTVQDTISPAAVCQNITVYLDGTSAATITAADIDNGSSDNCTLGTLTASLTDFDCTDVGDVTVTLTVPDVNGNSKTCTSTVTVQDTISPAAVCQNITVYLDGTGAATITAADIDNGSSDNCTLGTLTASQTDFDCTDVGDVTVTLTVPDANGNSKNCTSTVTVQDTISPAAVCQNITVYLDGTGAATITAADIDNGSSDNCTLGTLTASQTDFDCTDVGDVTVTLTVPDVNGNSKTCTSTVTVQDTISPVAICKNIIINLDNNGNATITSDDINNGSFDECGAILSLDKTDFNSSDIGDNEVELLVTDNNGNTATCMAVVTVGDNIPPQMQCNTIDIFLDDNGRYVLEPKDINALSAGTTDNQTSYENLVFKVYPLVYSCENAGQEVHVSVAATDRAGNRDKCWALVSVIDTFKLEAEPVDDINVTIAAGECETKINYPEMTTPNLCALYTHVVGLGPDGLFPVGTTVEKWILTNASGDTVEVSFKVIVVAENELPAIDPVNNVKLNQGVDLVQIPLTGISYGADCFPQLVTVSASGVNAALISSIDVNYISPATDGVLNAKLVPGASGTDTITVKVADSEGGFVTDTFVIIVNALPTINPVADIETNEGVSIVTLSLNGISSGSVAEIQTISVNAVSTNATLVAGINVNYTSPDATGSLAIAIHPNTFGTDTISIVVSDGEASVTEVFVLKVNHVNHQPVVVNPIADQLVYASYILKIPVNYSALPVFDDIDGDLLMFGILVDGTPEIPSWMSVVNDTLILAPAIADTGCVEVVIVASDPLGEMAMDTFQLCVEGYPTGADNIASIFEVQMYPNPSKGEVNLLIRSSMVNDSEVTVRSITGSEVFRKTYKAAENIRIDLSEQVSGIYLVTLKMGDQSAVKKLILDRK